MFCKNCGSQYPEWSKFCNVCGAKLEPEQVQEPVAQVPPTEPVTQAVTEPTAQVTEAELPAEPEAPAEQVPTTEPATQEVPVAPMPVAPENSGNQAPDAQPAKPKKKRKVLWIVLACVLVLAIAAAVLSYIFIFNTTERKLSSAVDNTKAELEAALGNSDNFLTLLERCEEISDDDGYTMIMDSKIVSEADYYSSEQTQRIEISYDLRNKQMSGTVVTDSNMQWNEEWFSDEETQSSSKVEFYADEEELLLLVEDFDEDPFMIPLEDFGEVFAESYLGGKIEDEELLNTLRKLTINLFAESNWEAFCQAYPAAKEFTDALELREVDEKIPNAENMTVYAVQIDLKNFSEIAFDYFEFYLGELIGAGVTRELLDDEVREEFEDLFYELEYDTIHVWLGVNEDDCLAALHIFPEGTQEEESLSIILKGEENLFNEIVLYEDGKAEFIVSIEKTKDGFTLSAGESELTTYLECVDRNHELLIYDEDGALALAFEYDIADEGVTFSFNYTIEEDSEYYWYSDSMDYTIQLVPLQPINKPKGEAIAVLELTGNELRELIEKIDAYMYEIEEYY